MSVFHLSAGVDKIRRYTNYFKCQQTRPTIEIKTAILSGVDDIIIFDMMNK